MQYGMELIQRYKEAVTVHGFVTWMFEDSSSTWSKFTLMGNNALESMYKVSICILFLSFFLLAYCTF